MVNKLRSKSDLVDTMRSLLDRTCPMLVDAQCVQIITEKVQYIYMNIRVACVYLLYTSNVYVNYLCDEVNWFQVCGSLCDPSLSLSQEEEEEEKLKAKKAILLLKVQYVHEPC